MTIETVDVPFKNGDLTHSYVKLPEVSPYIILNLQPSQLPLAPHPHWERHCGLGSEPKDDPKKVVQNTRPFFAIFRVCQDWVSFPEYIYIYTIYVYIYIYAIYTHNQSPGFCSPSLVVVQLQSLSTLFDRDEFLATVETSLGGFQIPPRWKDPQRRSDRIFMVEINDFAEIYSGYSGVQPYRRCSFI